MRKTNFKEHVRLAADELPHYLNVDEGEELNFKMPGITAVVGHNLTSPDTFIRCIGDYCIENAEREDRLAFIDVSATHMNDGTMELLNELCTEREGGLPKKYDSTQVTDIQRLYNKVAENLLSRRDGNIFHFFMMKFYLGMISNDTCYVLHYPEHGLHPSMQVQFGKFLVKFQKLTGAKFIVLTHSHFLLDAIVQYTEREYMNAPKLPLAFYLLDVKCNAPNAQGFIQKSVSEIALHDIDKMYGCWYGAVEKLDQLREENESNIEDVKPAWHQEL